MIETNLDDSIGANLGRCKELLESAQSDLMLSTRALEMLLETIQSDREGDLHESLRGVYSAFSKVFRAEQLVHLARCTPPAELQHIPVDDSDVEPET